MNHWYRITEIGITKLFFKKTHEQCIIYNEEKKFYVFPLLSIIAKRLKNVIYLRACPFLEQTVTSHWKNNTVFMFKEMQAFQL